jgi:putative membrane-bound dehydrogenase-like protein
MKKCYLLFSICTTIFIINISFQACTSDNTVIEDKLPQILAVIPEKAVQLSNEIRDEVAVEMIDGIELSLWASDSIVHDPVAISMAPNGDIFYTQGNRLENSEFDIRGHRDWMTESISWQTVEDRRAFLRKTFTDDSEQSKKHLKDLNEDGVLNWKDLTVEKEEIWRVSDHDQDGIAETAQLYMADFNEEITDLANGVEFFEDEVYIAVGPDLWKARDLDGDGDADTKESLAHGFGVHIGFGAHGMSGVTVGPDGRLYWGIGDIGMNVVDKSGKRWKYPNQGVIVRCERDGSNFEVFSAGHRNTHEFVFDKYGNLISEDNDGDHRGERERLVYIVNGSDSGWRINWQFGKYTDPKNNSYKVWMDEKMHVPRWDGQAAYFIPPIANYVNGPTGMVYNPGTALGSRWKDHFFIAEFRGTPANSPIHAFTLKPKGAGFDLDQTTEVIKGLLPTGLDFGPDGALYFADWIDGWGTNKLGRLWKIDEIDTDIADVRTKTKELILSDFANKTTEQLLELLSYEDMRIRQKAQFGLVDLGDEGYDLLKNHAKTSTHQLSRIHALWGMGQFTRKQHSRGKDFAPFLSDLDEEIVAQAAKLIGDMKYDGSSTTLVTLVNHSNPRVQFFATEALGRSKDTAGIDAIIQMLIKNNDEDVYLRHAGALALARIEAADQVAALVNHESRALRIAAVVALRRMQSPKVSAFLKDEDEFIVAEAARAINDDWSIESSLPDLAELLDQDRFTNEALIRRTINANLRVGDDNALDRVLRYAKNTSAPEKMRSEALETIRTWAEPSVHDRVDGRYRGVVKRDIDPVKERIGNQMDKFLKDEKSSVVISAIQTVSGFNLTESIPTLLTLITDHNKSAVRSESLSAIAKLNYAKLDEVLSVALTDKSKKVRAMALSIIPQSEIEENTAVSLLESMYKNGTRLEKQSVIASIAEYSGVEAVNLLTEEFARLQSGDLEKELHLDILEAIKTQDNIQLMQQLNSFEAEKDTSNTIALYTETMFGGNEANGENIFYRNEAAQCVRCHSIYEWGGDAGPGLQGLASRMSKEEILESLIDPSAKIAIGYSVVSLELNNGEEIVAPVVNETDESLQLRIGKNEMRSVNKSDIALREGIPSSMPGVKNILSKMEIRDLVAFLSSLELKES